MPEGPGRPSAGSVPLSAARLSVQLSPEGQQIVNELMKTEGISDRSQILDRIVKDYGDKVKGIKPALIRSGRIIETADGSQALSDFAKPDAQGIDGTETDMRQLLQTRIASLRMKEIQRTIKSMEQEDSGGLGGLDGIMKLAYMDRLQASQQGPEDNPMKEMMNMLMPIYGLKMLDKQIGGGDDDRVSREIRELKDLFKGQQNNGQQNTAVIELQKKLEKMEEDKRYQELLRTVSEKAGTHKESLDMMKLVEENKQKTDTKLETLRQQYQEAQDKIRQEQMQDIRTELQRIKQEGSTGINKMIKETAEKHLQDTITKGFQAASGEQSTGQLATGLITSVIDRIREPILEPLGQALAYKTAGVVPAAASQSYDRPPMPDTGTGMPPPEVATEPPDYINSFLPGTPADKLPLPR